MGQWPIKLPTRLFSFEEGLLSFEVAVSAKDHILGFRGFSSGELDGGDRVRSELHSSESFTLGSERGDDGLKLDSTEVH